MSEPEYYLITAEELEHTKSIDWECYHCENVLRNVEHRPVIGQIAELLNPDLQTMMISLKAKLMDPVQAEKIRDLLGDISGPEFIYYVGRIVEKFNEPRDEP